MLEVASVLPFPAVFASGSSRSSILRAKIAVLPFSEKARLFVVYFDEHLGLFQAEITTVFVGFAQGFWVLFRLHFFRAMSDRPIPPTNIYHISLRFFRKHPGVMSLANLLRLRRLLSPFTL